MIFALTLTAITTSSALAADREVCFNLYIADNRDDAGCATASDPGVRRACEPFEAGTPTNTIPAVGAVMELWDKDGSNSANDDFIATIVKTESGRQCITFNWEGSAAQVLDGEANPDIYIRLPYRVQNTNGSVEVTQLDGDDMLPRTTFSFRNGPSGDPDKFVASDCPVNTECQILPVGFAMVPSTNVYSETALTLMALDSVQHTLEVFHSSFTKEIDMVLPCDDAGCTIARSVNDHEIQLQFVDAAADPAAGPHEMGHAIHKQRIDRNNLASDCSNRSGIQDPSSESCATSEGFATFVAAASLWNDDNDNSEPKLWGLDIEEPEPIETTSCAANIEIEGMAARGFWDVADSNEDDHVAPAGADDTVNISEQTVANEWDEFPNGTSNRKDKESDSRGPNLRDYFVNVDPVLSVGIFTTLLNHNCMGHQDNN